VATILKITKTS